MEKYHGGVDTVPLSLSWFLKTVHLIRKLFNWYTCFTLFCFVLDSWFLINNTQDVYCAFRSEYGNGHSYIFSLLWNHRFLYTCMLIYPPTYIASTTHHLLSHSPLLLHNTLVIFRVSDVNLSASAITVLTANSFILANQPIQHHYFLYPSI